MRPTLVRSVLPLSKAQLGGLVAAVLAVLVSHAAAKSNTPVPVSTSWVALHIRILEPPSGHAPKDESAVVVWLVPRDHISKVGVDAPRQRYQMMEHNKAFEPHLLVVPAGSTVEFPNLDPWFHNAFSISSRPFDLGFYPRGVQKSVRFGHPGVSYVFCRIHPEMAAVILTVESSYFGVSDRAGRISIGGVPPGKYFLRVWYEGASWKALEARQRPVLVAQNAGESPTISLAVTRQNPPARSLCGD